MTRISLDGLNVNILTLDIETRPALSYHWGMYDQTIHPVQNVEMDGVLCFAAKWYDRKSVMFHADWTDGHVGMIEAAHDLLTRADIVYTWNGDKFDLKHLNREFLLAGLGLPAPYRSMDLLKTSRKQFKFMSHKLDEVAKAVGVGRKIPHTGMELWKRCLAGDPKAQALMARYNKNDVRLTEDVADVFRGYTTNHVPLSLWAADGQVCPTCGSADVTPAGWHRTNLTMFAAYKCGSCGLVSRAPHSKQRAGLRGAQ